MRPKQRVRGSGSRESAKACELAPGSRTHDDVLQDIGPRHRPGLRDAAALLGVPYPPPRLALVGLKQEKTLEVWADDGAGGWTRLRSYPVLAASGGPGPKRREGDLQVPEGVYRLTGFNPMSRYHLSIRVDYPNTDDRDAARIEGRSELGGDIFIHGRAASIGCLAIGDLAIEELYLLVAEVGLAHACLVLSPNAAPVAPEGSPRWIADLYARLQRELEAIRGSGNTNTAT
jgi:L,D-transpeptidase catalytic domain